MTTDQDVIELYRCLLGRAPENADTIKAFKSFYPNFERGRKAVFDSAEFQQYYARVTGKPAYGSENVAEDMALALLTRASAAVPEALAPDARTAPDPALAAGLKTIFQERPQARIAVVVGDTSPASLNDLIPFAGEAAVVQVAPGFPPAVPLASRLPGGAALFRLGSDADSVGALLQDVERHIDALYLLGRPASPAWVDSLRRRFAAQALVAIGPSRDGFDAPALSAAIAQAHPGETVLAWRGLLLHQFGGWMVPVRYTPPASVPPPPDLDRYPRLALAAIVRNEAVAITNMLRSVAPIASFIAVLDTGSVDATPALVEAFLRDSRIPGAFAITPHEAFGDDFSAMRNTAIGMVPDDIPWVLMLDADEELVPEDYVPLLELAAAGTHDAYALPRYNYPGLNKSGICAPYADRQTRLLRHSREGHVRYSGAVHETVRGVSTGQPPLDASAIGGARGGPHIHHLVRRFRTPEEEARKQEFYREIARRRAGG